MDVSSLSEGEVVLQFVRTRQAWYNQAELLGEDERARLYGQEEFGFYLGRIQDGGLVKQSGELFVRWKPVADKLVARLEAYDDAWEMLPYLSHVLADIGENATPDAFHQALLEHGLVDTTERQPLTSRDQELFQAATRQNRRLKP